MKLYYMCFTQEGSFKQPVKATENTYLKDTSCCKVICHTNAKPLWLLANLYHGTNYLWDNIELFRNKDNMYIKGSIKLPKYSTQEKIYKKLGIIN